MMDWIAENTAWMYWTWPSAVGFGALFAVFIAMGIWDRVSPSGVRTGFLPMPTTRGDRLFVIVVSSLGIFFVWIAVLGAAVLWAPLVIALGWGLMVGLRG